MEEELFYLSPIHLVRPPLSSSSDPDLALRRTEVRLQCEESFWEVISSSNQQVNSTNVVLIFPGKFSNSIGSAQSFGGKNGNMLCFCMGLGPKQASQYLTRINMKFNGPIRGLLFKGSNVCPKYFPVSQQNE